MPAAEKEAWDAFSAVSTRVSDRKKREMWRLARQAPPSKGAAQLSEHQMKRRRAEELPGQVFEELCLPARQEGRATVLCAKVRELLVHACQAQYWRDAFAHARAGGDLLTPVVYHDEVHAGHTQP